MNIIINNCKQGMNGVLNLVKNGDTFLRRYATTITDYKITWKRPEKVSNLSAEQSGDQGLEIEVKSSDLRVMYDKSPELKDASDIVQKMFTLQFLPRKEKIRLRREKILELVKSHELDRKSPEAMIALMTSQIHQLRESLEENPKDVITKVALKETIEKRRKWLKYLRRWDYRRFEWVLEKLNLVYKQKPEEPYQITRKDSLRRLTKDHCDRLVQAKLDAYKKELKELQKDFYAQKVQKLIFIRSEELACGLKPSVSEDDIERAKQEAEECKKM
ncbi:hypothetical protein DMN91_007370 [Ooceraea biroi]|uniref:Small ribosomal subunit protein uS15m n=1 Tax=Ooceraea biroi TaxID=2015173 RepID=A0A026W8P0_OOCBI|nr:28S ribosomal protein S15, mitochondrial [Ooceraea biroi]EZA51394.1 28S ribosomal protein S15, mitochondrial [Ooceraea biroi]RLU20757.1 hypothetical protein DMN91_007370 [Ooceraea biroi]